MHVGKKWIIELDRLFKIIKSLIPLEELTDEQRGMIDVIRCDFFVPKKESEKKLKGYAIPEERKVFMNFEWFKESWDDPAFFFHNVGSDMMHEIAHILFPEKSDREIGEIVCHWKKESEEDISLHYTSDKEYEEYLELKKKEEESQK